MSLNELFWPFFLIKGSSISWVVCSWFSLDFDFETDFAGLYSFIVFEFANENGDLADKTKDESNLGNLVWEFTGKKCFFGWGALMLILKALHMLNSFK